MGLLDGVERPIQPLRVQPLRQGDQVDHQVEERAAGLPPIHLLHLGQVLLQGQRRDAFGAHRCSFALQFGFFRRPHLLCNVLSGHPHIPPCKIQRHGESFLQLRQQGQQRQGVHPLGDEAHVRLQGHFADLLHTRQHLRRQRVLGYSFHQRLLVQLPIVVELELFCGDQLLRDHVLRQACQQRGVNLLLGGGLSPLRRVIGHQLLPSARLRQQRLAQGHAWDGLHGLFDLPQLNAIPFELHLIVLPPGIIEAAVPPPPASVAGAVHGGRRLQQVGTERLGGQLRLVHVTASDPCPGDPDVTGLAGAEELAFLVQHVDPGVLHGLADGQDVVLRLPLGVHRKGGGLHGTLGGAVAVDHQAMGTAPEESVQNGLLQLLPAGQVALEPEGLFRAGSQGLVEQLHHQGRAVADIQAVQRLSQCQRAEFGLVGDDVQGVSAQQSREDLLH